MNKGMTISDDGKCDTHSIATDTRIATSSKRCAMRLAACKGCSFYSKATTRKTVLPVRNVSAAARNTQYTSREGSQLPSDVAAEIAFQEAEADLTAEDVLAMQYDVPDESELEEEAEAMLAAGHRVPDGEGAAPHLPQQPVEHDVNVHTDPSNSHKGFVLMEILAAAARGTDLDMTIAQFAEEIDDELLYLLQARIEATEKVVQQPHCTCQPLTSCVNEGAADQLRELWGVLRTVQQRVAATPAMRLLDDVLDLLGDDMSAVGYSMRRLEAQARMREAFTGGLSEDVDIFAAAAALADAGPAAAEELSSEAVSPTDFLQEVMALMEEAGEQQTALAQAIERADKEISFLRAHKPEALESEAAAAQRKALTAARRNFASRAVGLSQLQDVVSMARSLVFEMRKDSVAH
ncbi:hypothetical protein QJQ45_027585 [Haematococcus lacustris]|nr:hypothetical protein QJQ45_027585 [Haematococcus lacustris]